MMIDSMLINVLVYIINLYRRFPIQISTGNDFGQDLIQNFCGAFLLPLVYINFLTCKLKCKFIFFTHLLHFFSMIIINIL